MNSFASSEGLHLLYQSNRLAELAQACEAILRRGPDAHASNYLGILSRETRDISSALLHFKNAILAAHDFIPAYLNLARTFAMVSMHDKAAVAYRQALAFEPENAELLRGLADALVASNRFTETQPLLDKLAQLHPSPGYAFEHAGLMPAIWPDAASIHAWREDFVAHTSTLPQVELASLLAVSRYCKPQPPFDLVYQGAYNVVLKSAYASRFRYPVPVPLAREGVYRIGFFVDKNRDAVFMNIMGALLNSWDAPDMQPVLLTHAEDSQLRNYIFNPRVEICLYDEDWSKTEALRARLGLDVLYFWEVGTSLINYFLPFFRLAPVQVTSWGSVESTGHPCIDYFISSRHQETPGSERHYSETLVRFSHIPAIVPKPETGALLLARKADLGLEEHLHHYLCTQNIKKLHPDMDRVFKAILERDEAGILLLTAQHDTKEIADTFRARLEKALGPLMVRVRLLKHMHRPEYLALTRVADAVLDTFHYSGGQTSYDAFAVGAPVVALPGKTMRSRSTHAMYAAMNMTECTAESEAQYVDIAVRLGTDAAFRAAVREKILSRHQVLFDSVASYNEHLEFFRRAALESRAAPAIRMS